MCSVIYSGSVQLNVVCILHKLCSRGFVLFVFFVHKFTFIILVFNLIFLL